MKTLFRLVVLLVILVVVGLVVAAGYVDRVARVAVERGSTFALGVETTVDGADVGILGGRFDLEGLTVANPAGFDAPHFLALDAGGVSVSFASLREELVELPRLELHGMDMHLQRSASGANYKPILKSLERFRSEEAPEKSEGKRFVIRDVALTGINVHVDVTTVGGSLTRVDVPIDEIRLTDVGMKGNRGVVMGELASVLVQAVLAAVVDRAGNILPAAFIASLESRLGDLDSLTSMGIGLSSRADELAGKADEIRSLLDETTKGIQDAGDAAGDLIKGIGDVFGGGKDG